MSSERRVTLRRTAGLAWFAATPPVAVEAAERAGAERFVFVSAAGFRTPEAARRRPFRGGGTAGLEAVATLLADLETQSEDRAASGGSRFAAHERELLPALRRMRGFEPQLNRYRAWRAERDRHEAGTDEE